jgi:SET domain-containing protein
MSTYRPLPEMLTIKPSGIEGLGTFSIEPIKVGTTLGITHIYNENFEDNLIRTPLGGFINHSETPNCKLVDVNDRKILVTLKPISTDEELTLKYTIYDPTK